MAVPIAVEVNRKREVGGGAILVDVFGQQQRIGAQIDEFLARNDCGDDFGHFLVNEWLTAGNGHDGRAAFVNGIECVRDTHPLLQDLLWIVDLAAAGAGEVALEKRLQHEDQRIAFLAAQLTAGKIPPDAVHLKKWNTHALFYQYRAAAARPMKLMPISAHIAMITMDAALFIEVPARPCGGPAICGSIRA